MFYRCKLECLVAGKEIYFPAIL
ncbi:hypothetical protein F383_37442 [Gossypium arboreum]|uniref:Uncharacterized protein n=1 Tax=Gossypium arboreum TaxID=29729 RepID=A0A0B0NFD2_GOSAR|nr:hypothetical protein F383_37442 [Gossypium arboreum]